ncbi:uncharacterized protein C7orf50 homolog isoform X2 [Emydura macquarii macquarii]|uniref:uncharacterized protein C7orf50 homolog isoform X2 n=1 Tax=Emydura macquarii macquarii TaxID=1129001 RepID=UPI00352A8B03
MLHAFLPPCKRVEKSKKNIEMKGEKRRKKLKRHVAEKEQLVHETEPKKKKQNLKRTKKEVEEANELNTEKKRTLERKLKKERKKEEKKLMREAGIAAKKEEPKKPSGAELALEYLSSWSKKTNEWKFQKTRQTWLLLHMYDKEKVPDEYFSVLLDYLEGLKGSARDVTMQKAEALMKEYDNSDTEDPGLLEKCERIRKVLQLLS